ncbi:amidohydrolase [Biformimicrobium ophioploci]|uniref:Amidohydrolase n=1 Tax=Biformimicrobium ophioploci TaxID=3036711 RepID=A0ABQ6LY78_9GAMM|nr:amidohydrolase [Microbulbifer sp. NKW57]GMG87030.1 amidohydrolase [Microbulbifer sp. NKW57]
MPGSSGIAARLLLLFLVFLVGSCVTPRPTGTADTILRGGTLITLDDKYKDATAIAVQNGRILAVGSEADMAAYTASHTEFIELEGRTLLPGFIDAHGHLIQQAMARAVAGLKPPPMGTVRDISSLQQKLREDGSNHPGGNWILGFGYDERQLKERRHPTRWDLDRVSNTRPVVAVHLSGRIAVVNSVVLQKLGQQAYNPVAGAIFRKDPRTGQLNGVIEERAMDVIADLIPAPSALKAVGILKEVQDDYLAAGITTVQDGWATLSAIKLYRAGADFGMLNLDIVAYLPASTLDMVDADDYRPEPYEGRFRIGGVKMVVDGSSQLGSAYQNAPYMKVSAKTGDRGFLLTREEQLDLWLRRYAQQGWQPLISASGDAAIDTAIEAIDKAGGGERLSSPVMVAPQLMSRAQARKLAKQDVAISFSPVQIYYWSDWLAEILGTERARAFGPVATAIDAGALVTLNSETPAAGPDMMQLIWSAVTRANRDGVSQPSDERISVEQALRAVTLDAARQYGEGEQKGSLTPGKSADFVILEQNPLQVDEAALPAIEVHSTWKDGEQVYPEEDPLGFF